MSKHQWVPEEHSLLHKLQHGLRLLYMLDEEELYMIYERAPLCDGPKMTRLCEELRMHPNRKLRDFAEAYLDIVYATARA